MGLACTLFAVHESMTREILACEDSSEIMEHLDGSAVLELGQVWDAVHFSLGAHDGHHPLAFLESGGVNVPALDDREWSEGRYFDSPQTARILDALCSVPDERLSSNFARRDEIGDPDSLYPSGLRPFDVGDVLGHVARLRAFLAEAARTGRGIIVHISG